MEDPRTPSADRVRIAAEFLKMGEVIAGRAVKLTLARVLAFSGGVFDEPGWPHPNLHTNLDKAREAGLDGIIASGTQSEGLLLGLLIDVFGPAWHRTGTFEVRFLKPVRIDTVVQPMFRVTGQETTAEGIRVTGDCWCQSERGDHLIAGTASCVVRSADGAVA